MATLSRRVKDLVEGSFVRTSDGGASSPLVSSRLHDFGAHAYHITANCILDLQDYTIYYYYRSSELQHRIE